MKINGKKFIDTLAAISKIAIKDNSPENANTVTLYCGNNALQMVATNSNIQVAAKIDAETETEKWSESLNLGDLVKKLPAVMNTKDKEALIEIRKEGSNIIFSEIGELTIQTVPNKATGFIAIPDDNFSVSFMSHELVSAINATYLAVDSVNDVMSHIKIDFNAENESLGMTAINGLLICVYDIPLEDINSSSVSKTTLVAGKTLKSAIDILSLVSDDEMKLTFTDNYLGLSSGDLKVVVPVKNSKFVACEKLLNNKIDSTVVFNVKELKKDITATNKVVKQNITFSYDGNTASLTAYGFNKPINVVSSDIVKFTLPIDLVKNIIGVVNGTTIQFGISNTGIIEVSIPDNDMLKYITTRCRE